MQAMFETLFSLMKEPLRPDRGVKTDNSILLIYPPERELDFREQLFDAFLPALEAQRVPLQHIDLGGLMFRGLNDEEVTALQEDEFDDYRWMIQGLSKRVEATLHEEIRALARRHPGANIIVHHTVAVYPLVRFGEVLRDLRDLESRIALAFPGEERGGKLHFMNQPDGGNYLAVKLFW